MTSFHDKIPKLSFAKRTSNIICSLQRVQLVRSFTSLSLKRHKVNILNKLCVKHAIFQQNKINKKPAYSKKKSKNKLKK